MPTHLPYSGPSPAGPFDLTPDAATVAHRLGGRKAGENDWRIPHLCGGAARGDRLSDNPGLSVADGDKGLIVFCHYGCDTADAYAAIRAALGIENRRQVRSPVTPWLTCPDCGTYLPADGLIPHTGWPALSCSCGASFDALLSAVQGDPWTAWAEYSLVDGYSRRMVRRFPPRAGQPKTTWLDFTHNLEKV